MAIAFDAATDGGNNGGSSSSQTFSHTCTGSDRFLFVGAMGGTAANGDLITAATYNSVSMSLIAKRAPPDATCRWAYLFGLTAPATGANNVVVSASSNVFILPGASSYTGVSQTGQPEAEFDADRARTNISMDVVSTTDNAWGVLFCGCFGSDFPSAGAGTTERAQDNAFGTWGLFDSGSAWTPAGTHNLTATYPSGTTLANAIIVAFAPAGAAAGNPWYAYAQQRTQVVKRAWQRLGALWTPDYGAPSYAFGNSR